MRLPTFLFVFLCVLVASTARADTLKIVLLETMPVPIVTAHSQAIVQALGEQGYLNGENIDLEILKAEGDKELAVRLLKKTLTKQRPDLVITVATLASQAAVETLAGTNIPILFCVVSDPVGSGIVKQLDTASGTNVSGVVFTQQRDTKVEMVMRLLTHPLKSGPVKLGIVSTDYPSAVGDIRELKKIAALSDELEFVVQQIPYEGIPDGLPAMRKTYQRAVDSLKGKVDFLWQVSGPLNELNEFTKMLLASGIPLIHGHTIKSVKQGAVITVRYDTQSAADLVVEVADKIFKGADVGNLPVSEPKNFNLYLNLKTADQIGLTIPSHLLMIAGKNVVR